MRGVCSELHPLAVTPIALPSKKGKAAFSIAFKRPFPSMFLNIVFFLSFYLVISGRMEFVDSARCLMALTRDHEKN